MIDEDLSFNIPQKKDSITKKEIAQILSVVDGQIYSVDYTVQKGKETPFVIYGVVVTINSGDDDLHFLKNDDYYLIRALNLKDIKKSEAHKYKVLDITNLKVVKGI